MVLRPNRGAFVAVLTAEQLGEIAEACRLLEAHLLERALPGLTPARLEEAEGLLATLDEIDDPSEWSRVNWRFHSILQAAAERPLHVELLTSLRARAELALQILVAEKTRWRALNREHRAILEAIRERSWSQALVLLDEHLAGGQSRVQGLISKR